PGSDATATDAGTLTVVLGRALGSPILAGLTGSASADNIVGTDGNDDVFGNGGADAISTGAGNDIIAIGDLDFAKINGGRGQLGDRTDVLALHSGHTQLDVTTLQPEQIRNIELIELGDLNNSLHLSKLGLLALSRETNRLYVHGGSSDIVTVRSGEVWAEAGAETVGGTEYNVYIAEGAELYIQPAVTQTGIGSFSGSQRYNFNTSSTGANVSNNVEDFAVLIRITDPSVIDAVQPDARDIRFLAADGRTWLHYEIERWDQAANLAEVWVHVPIIYGNTNGASTTSCQSRGVASGRCNYITM